jgi:hypothetical protein
MAKTLLKLQQLAIPVRARQLLVASCTIRPSRPRLVKVIAHQSNVATLFVGLAIPLLRVQMKMNARTPVNVLAMSFWSRMYPRET